MKRLTAEWVMKAEEDFAAARELARARKRLHDGVCFHCQQSAEKYLKALLEERGLAVPKTHILVSLLPLLRPHFPGIQSLRRGTDFLTRFAVDTRYPGHRATKRQAESSLRWAQRVRDTIRPLLGLK